MFWSAFALAVLSMALVTTLARWYKSYARRVHGKFDYHMMWGVQVGYCLVALVSTILPLWGDVSQKTALILAGVATIIFALDMVFVRRAERKFQADVAQYLPPKKPRNE